MSKDNVIQKYLEEMKAKEKSNSISEFSHRILAEKEIRNILYKFREYNIHFNELLSIKGEDDVRIKPDFIIYKNDIEIPLFLKIFDKDKFSLDNNELLNYVKIITESDYNYLLITFMKYPDFPTFTIKNSEVSEIILKKIININDNNSDKLEVIIKKIFSSLDYRIPVEDIEIRKKISLENLLDVLNNTCVTHITESKIKRRPRIEYKIKALNDINKHDIEFICDMINNYILNDIDKNEFIELLNNKYINGV